MTSLVTWSAHRATSNAVCDGACRFRSTRPHRRSPSRRIPMAQHHPFEPYVEVASTWLNQLSTSLALSPTEDQRALHALRAGLHAIRDRLPASEAVDLGAQLPT